MTDPDASPPESAAAPEPGPGDVAATYCATLVDQWVSLGLSHAVIAPGSRSTPMALALAGDARLHVEVVHDERAAAFVALGLGIATGRPAVVLSTSGTAAVNLHPAVVEADLAGVPMLVITADRPPEMHGVLAPQTIEQRDLYGSAVRWYCEPGPPDWGGAPWWRDMAADAWRRTRGLPPGPVHLDLAFREPLVGSPGPLPGPVGAAGSAPAAPVGPTAPAWGLTDEDLGRLGALIGGRRGVVVAGARAATDRQEADAVEALAVHLGWPILADAPSGLRRPGSAAVCHFDQLLRHTPFAEEHRPEVVLRLGGLLASRVTNEWLATSGATQVGIDRHGRCPDPDRVLAARHCALPAEVAGRLMGLAPRAAAPDWPAQWQEADRRAAAALQRALLRVSGASEPAVAMDLMSQVPPGTTVVTSSSMPVRDLEWFAPPRDDVAVRANRGANGIDGVTATAVGVALAAPGPTVLLTGDVAFLHDSSALVGLRRRAVDLVVVVVDNDGGGIFGFLPQSTELDPVTFETLFGTPHGTDLAALAEANGLPAEVVGSRAGFQAALSGALSRRGVRVVVVRSDRAANVEVHRRLAAAVAAALEA